jgi:hypothetical protein
MRTIGLCMVFLSLFLGCGILGERPDDPPAVNDHDAGLVGSWNNDSLSVRLTFDGDEMTSIACDSSACTRHVFPYRTYNGSLFKDFITTYTCDSSGNGCSKVSEFPLNTIESYEVFSGGDSLGIAQLKYRRI